jgi:hypothetical protein
MKIETLLENGKEFLANSEYQRISKGHLLTLNKVPYNKEIYQNLIKHFEEREEYEKCANLKKLETKRFNHESNFTLN